MSNAYEQIAVSSLATYLAAHLPAALRAVETADSLTVSSIPDPVAYVQAEVPADTRSPLVMVFDVASIPEQAGHRNHLAEVDCTIGVLYSSDADLEGAELLMRRYVRALRDVLDLDPHLGGTVAAAWWTDENRNPPMTYDSATRHGRALGVTVRVHSP